MKFYVCASLSDSVWLLIVALLIGFVAWMFAMGMWLWMGSVLGKVFAFDRSKVFSALMHASSIAFALWCAYVAHGSFLEADARERMRHGQWKATLVTEEIVIEDIELAGRCRLLKTDNHPERLVASYYGDASHDKFVVGGRYEIRREGSLIHFHKRLPDVMGQ